MSELKQKILKHELAEAGFPDAEYRGVPGRMFIDRKNDRMPDINDAGDIHYGTEYNHMAIHTIRPIVDRVNEMIAAWELSYQHNFKDASKYRIVAEYNNVVLAARDDTELGRGFNFVTWKYNQEHTGFDYGNYTTDYDAAKEDFAVRAGLIRRTKVFDKEQAAEIKNAVMYRIENDGDLTISAEEQLRSIAARLTDGYNLTEANPIDFVVPDNAEPTEVVTQSETHIAFTERIEQTMKDYANGRLSGNEQDADAIGMSASYMYLRSGEHLSDSDMQYLLRFRNPLQVVADVYSNLDGAPGIEFALNRVLNNYNGCTNGYALADINYQNETQTAEVINGKLNIGDWVIAAPSDEYGYLLGTVTAIDKLGTPEHGTDNTGDDIHVDFYAFDYPPERIAEIEEVFSDLYGEPKQFDELPIDDVIMAPDTLIRITELGHDEITRMGNLLQNCVAFCNCFSGAVEPQGDLHAALMARLGKNLADYHNSLLGFGNREIIDMAGKIAAMKDVHDYMTTTRGFDDDEIQFYLQFQNPLEVVADAWLERNADNEDLCFTMDFLFDKKDALVDYPLMSDLTALADITTEKTVQDSTPSEPPARKSKRSLGEKLHAAGEKVKAQNTHENNNTSRQRDERS